PSIPAVVYAVQAGISTGGLFAAGVIPGVAMGIAQMIMCYYIGKKNNYFQPKMSLQVRWKRFIEALPALFAPVLIIGGMFSGIFTPTESAAVTVIYGAIVGLFIYRELKLKDLKKILFESIETTAVLMIIIGAVSVFGWILVRELIPQTLCLYIMSLSDNPYVLMLLIAAFLLIVGCFLTPSAAILVLVPILKPLMDTIGVHPMQFGMLIVYTLCIGNVTPPVGNILYVVAKVADIPAERLMKAMIPWYIPLASIVFFIIFFPFITTWLPDLLGFSFK
ncbi:MAG: TRAP transporter large permease, partial [Clostridiaceae bacterium]|nr:TRAP transporter large permease [Clostridiaceae bacterium]